MIDLIAAFVLSATHPAPRYVAPVKVIPLIVHDRPAAVLDRYEWGPGR